MIGIDRYEIWDAASATMLAAFDDPAQVYEYIEFFRSERMSDDQLYINDTEELTEYTFEEFIAEGVDTQPFG